MFRRIVLGERVAEIEIMLLGADADMGRDVKAGLPRGEEGEGAVNVEIERDQLAIMVPVRTLLKTKVIFMKAMELKMQQQVR